ncbi:MAG TPA: hypothetical protein VN253_10620, partial [Kofleriaceae bacterium]|nr:hypothetical protein [Kofleriaceae bacterium]
MQFPAKIAAQQVLCVEDHAHIEPHRSPLMKKARLARTTLSAAAAGAAALLAGCGDNMKASLHDA